MDALMNAFGAEGILCLGGVLLLVLVGSVYSLLDNRKTKPKRRISRSIQDNT